MNQNVDRSNLVFRLLTAVAVVLVFSTFPLGFTSHPWLAIASGWIGGALLVCLFVHAANAKPSPAPEPASDRDTRAD